MADRVLLREQGRVVPESAVPAVSELLPASVADVAMAVSVASVSRQQQRTRALHHLSLVTVRDGRKLTLAREGAKGMSGIRFDVLHGRATIAYLLSLSTLELAKKYKMTRAGAEYCRSRLRKYGINGATRRYGG